MQLKDDSYLKQGDKTAINKAEHFSEYKQAHETK